MTDTSSSKLDPSLTTISGLRPVKNEGGHINESSRGKASSLVALRDRLRPVESKSFKNIEVKLFKKVRFVL